MEVETNHNPQGPANWNKFRNTGLLLIINQLLHIFGWAIVVEIDSKGNVISGYPSRVAFRGFDEKNQTEAYIKISKYMKENADDLLNEVEE